MLLRQQTLESIRAGEVTLVFRRWKRPGVKSGGSLMTAVGLLAIDDVSPVKLSAITTDDAANAGYDSRSVLLEELRRRDGDIYRIAVRYAGADSRIALRQKASMTKVEYEDLVARLQTFDRYSRKGPWTRQVLDIIAKHPLLAAKDLAHHLGFEKDWLKVNVRKLKNLGLTVSHQPGYELSPRGKALLKRMTKDTLPKRGR